MDREQEEMQFLGVFGIYAEACKIILSWKKIFTRITLAFLFPWTFIYLAQFKASHILSAKLIHNEIIPFETQPGTPRFNNVSNLVYSESTTTILFKIAYSISLFILSLLNTSAVVYTIACVYTSRDITFRKVMSVVPKVFKRLMVTFFSMFLVMFAYNMVAVFVIFLYVILTGLKSNLSIAILIVIPIVYIVGFGYMSLIWCLSNVVSVLEDACGFSAMKKSKYLMKGKMLVTLIINLKLSLLFSIVQLSYEKMAVSGNSLNVGGRVAYGILCFFCLVMLMLFQLVVHTVIYFVCKSYHHENIDKSALSDHLEVYLGEYVPLKTKDVQLEQFNV